MAEKWNLRRPEDADMVFFIRELNVMIEQEGNYLASYDLILDSLGDEAAKRKIGEFRRDHERHVTDLTSAVHNLGGEALEPEGPTPAAELEDEWMESVDDDAVLLAYFEIGERQSVAAYDARRGMPDLPQEANDVLERAFLDEERHHAWAMGQIGRQVAGAPRRAV